MRTVEKEAQILYDARGKKTHVVLPIKRCEEMLERLEDAGDIKAIRAVLHERTIPWRAARNKLRKEAYR
ncbi:MAG: hypothetical protein AABZ02_12295 [Bacteroidota bacterium]